MWANASYALALFWGAIASITAPEFSLVFWLEVLTGITSITTLLLAMTVLQQGRMAAALKLSEEKFSKAVAFSPDAVTLSYLSNGQFLEVNDSFVKLTGYTREEALGRTSIDLGLWHNPDERRDLVESIQQSGTVYNRDIVFHHKDGSAIQTLLSTSVFEFNHRPCLLTVVRDVTDHKRAQETLRLSAERDRLLGEIAIRIRQSLDLNDILEATVTEVRRVLRVDRAFVHRMRDPSTSGNSSEIVAESVTEPFDSILGRADEIPTEDIRTMMGEKSVVQVDDIGLLEPTCPYRNFVQRYETKSAMGAAIVVEGELFGVLVVHQCSQSRQWQSRESELLERISTQVAIAIQQAMLLERVQRLNAGLEQQVEERTAQLQHQMQKVQDLNSVQHFFLHAITHDLCTSVSGNLMLLETLESQSREAVSLPTSLLKQMRQASEVQLRKLENLKEIYRARMAGLNLEQTTVCLAHLVDQVIAELAPLLHENHAQLTVDIPNDLPQIWVDPKLTQQVLRQLIVNAVGHNFPKVTVTLTAQRHETAVRCCITDNGKGIDPERCDRLFDLYVDCPDSRHYRGVSLGLYRCRQIVEAHGGTIDVESQQGRGTTLTFTLPLDS